MAIREHLSLKPALLCGLHKNSRKAIKKIKKKNNKKSIKKSIGLTEKKLLRLNSIVHVLK
jgi:hypothetical protein